MSLSSEDMDLEINLTAWQLPQDRRPNAAKAAPFIKRPSRIIDSDSEEENNPREQLSSVAAAKRRRGGPAQYNANRERRRVVNVPIRYTDDFASRRPPIPPVKQEKPLRRDSTNQPKNVSMQDPIESFNHEQIAIKQGSIARREKLISELETYNAERMKTLSDALDATLSSIDEGIARQSLQIDQKASRSRQVISISAAKERQKINLWEKGQLEALEKRKSREIHTVVIKAGEERNTRTKETEAQTSSFVAEMREKVAQIRKQIETCRAELMVLESSMRGVEGKAKLSRAKALAGGLDPKNILQVRMIMKMEDSDSEEHPGGSEGALISESISEHPTRAKLAEVIYEVQKLDCAYWFRFPVDVTGLRIPGYLKIVKRPMAISDIKEKLNNGKYENDILEFVADFDLIYQNTVIFNGEDHDVTEDARDMWHGFKKNMVKVGLGEFVGA